MKKNIWFRLSLILNAILIMALIVVFYKVDAGNAELPKKKIHLKYEQRVSIFNDVPTKHADVVFLGDSITERSLWNEFFPHTFVVNRGIESDTTKGVLKRLNNVVKLQPKKLFLLIGVNDLNSGTKVNHVFKRYRNIVSTIQTDSPHTQIYLQSVLPVVEGERPVQNKDIDALNREIQSLADSKSVFYIDINSKLKLNHTGLDPKYTNDGIHLLGNAYVVWADTLREYVE
ncbi:GDSL-type esterase/lipase family protein [Cytobacillus sp. Hz8]|uniref:GDSL-type esterase/lipase family protein n=1 Tax=Cytobacillus sp. Hz8 TaxID=3347168 RepID=UPI0035DB82A6